MDKSEPKMIMEYLKENLSGLRIISLTLPLAFVIIMACSDDPAIDTAGTASLDIQITGLPVDVHPSLTIEGPDGFRKTLTVPAVLQQLKTGTYSVKTRIECQPQKLTYKAYRTDQLDREIVVNGDVDLQLDYLYVQGSDKLWFGNHNAASGESAKVLGFSEDVLTSTGSPNPSVKLTNAIIAPSDLTFDPWGGLWVVDDKIKMFAWKEMGSTELEPKVILDVQARAITFDVGGNLWYSDGKSDGTIYKLEPESIKNSGIPTPSVIIKGLDVNGVRGLAFDRDGNLWVTNSGNETIAKFNSERLTSSIQSGADVVLYCRPLTSPATMLSEPMGIAFDDNENLWVSYFGQNIIVKIPNEALSATAVLTPVIQIEPDVSSLLNHLVFDGQGGLWIPHAKGEFGRYAPSQLNTSGKKTPETIISSPQTKYTNGMVIYKPSGCL